MSVLATSSGIARTLAFEFDERLRCPLMVMELVPGRTLDQIVRTDGPLAVDDALMILKQLAAALDGIHRRDVVHQDIKPKNIMIVGEGSSSAVKIIDFGLARDLTRPEVSESAAFAGTPAYMSPERLRGQGADRRCDLFAVGCVMHELLTGMTPYSGSSLIQHLRGDDWPAPPALLLPGDLPSRVSRTLRHVHRQLLNPSIDHRPRSAAEVARIFDATLRSLRSSAIRHATLSVPTSKTMSRGRLRLPRLRDGSGLHRTWNKNSGDNAVHCGENKVMGSGRRLRGSSQATRPTPRTERWIWIEAKKQRWSTERSLEDPKTFASSSTT